MLCLPLAIIGSLGKTRRRRQRQRHLKMSLRVSAIISQLFKVTMPAKCILTILELNWNQRFRRKTKLNICHHMLTLSTQLQNRSFSRHGKNENSCEMSTNETCTCNAKRANSLNCCFSLSNMQICDVLVAVVVVVP